MLQRQAGVTLPSLGLIDEQTIAGAVSTGTHGSGKHSLSHYVDEVTLATYDADTGEPIVRKIDAGSELLAARCSLGCLGVILSVGVKCRSSYQVEEHLCLIDGLEDVLAAEEDYPLQQFFLVPYLWRFLGQHRKEVDAPPSLLSPVYRAYWFLTIDLGLHLMLTTLVRQIGNQQLIRAFFRYLVPWAIPRGWHVVDRSHSMLTMQHELFRHIEIEVFVPRSQLAAALAFARELLQFAAGDTGALGAETRSRLADLDLAPAVEAIFGNYTHHYPVCVRKVLPDATLISMASGEFEPYYALSFISYDRPQNRDAFFRFADILNQTTTRLFQGRPHWGKVCQINARQAAQLYPRLIEFRAVCDKFDAGHVFRSAWLDQTLFFRPTVED